MILTEQGLERTSTWDEALMGFAYDNYIRAMNKRRPDSGLSKESFFCHLTQDNFPAFAFAEEADAVIGQFQNGCFCPSHFAPYGLKSSIDLVKSLREYDNVVFVVTPDLAKMLARLGYKRVMSTKATFHCQIVDKVIMVSSYKALAVYFSTAIKAKVSEVFSVVYAKTLQKIIKKIQLKFERITDYSNLVDEEMFV